MEKLCQLASSILDQQAQRELSVPPPTPVVRTRIRSSHYLRRRRRRMIPTNTSSTSSQPPTSILISTTPTSAPPSSSSPPPTLPEDYSRDSPVNLYWLFQDNITTSRTHAV